MGTEQKTCVGRVRLLNKVAKYEEERKTCVSLFSRAIMERSQSSFGHKHAPLRTHAKININTHRHPHTGTHTVQQGGTNLSLK